MGRTFSPACDLESRQLVWSLFQQIDGISTQVMFNQIPYVAPAWVCAQIFIEKKV
jgi:hypothetical protein